VGGTPMCRNEATSGRKLDADAPGVHPGKGRAARTVALQRR